MSNSGEIREQGEEEKTQGKAFGAVVYECVRCGTKQSWEELSALPDIRCINCGYIVLKKVRPPVVKHIGYAD
jgi:DNA-directed RNA polymerase subunit RPC12/RpoP